MMYFALLTEGFGIHELVILRVIDHENTDCQ